MRVYEFAKQKGLSSKDLMALLAQEGLEVSSHMAVLSEEALLILNNKIEKKGKPISVQTTPQKTTTPISSAKPAQEVKETIIAPAEQPLVKKAPEYKKFEEKKIEVAPLPLMPYTLSDLSLKIGKTTSDLILTLLKWGILSSKNQLLTVELVEKIAQHYEIPTIKQIEKIKHETKAIVEASDKEQLTQRLPVVVVMGHVDHGKTTLLDFIRKTRVAAKEKGGITQHLGAYEAQTPQGNLVFIDTPGHEAFSRIRIRGTRVADIVVLVVASDDGVMPQTVEALKHAQSMNVPIIVALNKIDKVDKARIEVVKRDLSTQHNLLPEEWGGQTMYMPISAKTGAGIDKLLEMIILQSQLMELQAQVSGPARGFALESKVEKGRGSVATVLTQHGTLHIGDYFVAGKTTGRISSMVDSFGQRVAEVLPSHPVQVAGFNELAQAGDYFETVDKETYLKAKQLFTAQRQPLASHFMDTKNSITLLVKTDTNSSKEALLESIAKISKKSEKGFVVLQASIGNVNESDVMLASNTNSRIITLHIKAENNAASLAQRLGVTINSYDIIYRLLESLQELATSMQTVKTERTKVGEALVRKVFDIKNLGVIAGCYLKQGLFSRDTFVIIWRGTKKVGEGKVSSLQRDKKTVKEVHAGYEFAFMLPDFKDWQVDDRIECFQERPIK